MVGIWLGQQRRLIGIWAWRWSHMTSMPHLVYNFRSDCLAAGSRCVRDIYDECNPDGALASVLLVG